MIRTALPAGAALAAALAGLAACTPAPAPQAVPYRAAPDTSSPIAGAVLPCPRDYPDSRLVFAPDGTLGGRYAGHDVTGQWTALGPGQVEMMLRAGGVAVHDTLRLTGRGWRGENTACG